MTIMDVFQMALAVIAFFAVHTLRGIESQLKEVKVSLKELEKDLRGGYSNLDRRLAIVEDRCHTNGCQEAG